MATTPRTKNPNDAALSAVEEALRLDYAPDEAPAATGTDDAAAERRDRRSEARAAAEAARRSESQRRSEGTRIPAPPARRPEGAPPPRREEPRREEPRREDPPRRVAEAPARAFADAPPEVEAPPSPRVRAAEARRSRFAANDDRRTVAGPMRRPSRLIYPTAIVLSAAWALFVVVYAMSTGGIFGSVSGGDIFSNPRFLDVALFLFVPIGFIW
ncbi:MAG TPA: hypothetical protein VG710_01120, partial [Opitutus sp.]|nr:hypothetical protein [Opitutus sp.]